MTHPTCRWKPSHGEGCGREAHGQREYCIFHLPEKKEHEVEEFAKALCDEIDSQRRRDPKKLSFDGFHFPCRIDLREMLAAKHLFPPTIEQDLWFPGCTFEQDLVAEGVQFLGHVLFGDAVFRKGVSLSGCAFTGIADFCRATFEGDAWFSGTKFLEANFTSAVFGCCAMFTNAEFLRDAYFPSVTFIDDSFFSDSTFKRDALFHGARFQKDVSFDPTTFEGNAVFDPTEFCGTADFTGSTFLKDLEMRPWPQQQAGAKVILSFTRFAQRVMLDLSEFLEPKSTVSTLLLLRECMSDGGSKMTLRGSMGCVSLLHTDLSKAVFVNECWLPRVDLAGSVRLGKRNAVLEEYALKRMANGEMDISELLRDADMDGIAQLYRRLRDNYEANKRYAEAGDFFIGEMEILRQYRTVHTREEEATSPQAPGRTVEKRPLSDPYRVLLLEPYRFLAFYGESIKRPAVFALLIVLAFTLVRPPIPLMLQSALPFPQSPALATDANLPTNATAIMNATWNAFQESIFAFFQLRAEGAADLFERLFSAPILGLLFIAMRRKLERR